MTMCSFIRLTKCFILVLVAADPESILGTLGVKAGIHPWIGNHSAAWTHIHTWGNLESYVYRVRRHARRTDGNLSSRTPEPGSCVASTLPARPRFNFFFEKHNRVVKIETYDNPQCVAVDSCTKFCTLTVSEYTLVLEGCSEEQQACHAKCLGVVQKLI